MTARCTTSVGPTKPGRTSVDPRDGVSTAKSGTVLPGRPAVAVKWRSDPDPGSANEGARDDKDDRGDRCRPGHRLARCGAVRPRGLPGRPRLEDRGEPRYLLRAARHAR